MEEGYEFGYGVNNDSLLDGYDLDEGCFEDVNNCSDKFNNIENNTIKEYELLDTYKTIVPSTSKCRYLLDDIPLTFDTTIAQGKTKARSDEVQSSTNSNNGTLYASRITNDLTVLKRDYGINIDTFTIEKEHTAFVPLERDAYDNILNKIKTTYLDQRDSGVIYEVIYYYHFNTNLSQVRHNIPDVKLLPGNEKILIRVHRQYLLHKRFTKGCLCGIEEIYNSLHANKTIDLNFDLAHKCEHTQSNVTIKYIHHDKTKQFAIPIDLIHTGNQADTVKLSVFCGDYKHSTEYAISIDEKCCAFFNNLSDMQEHPLRIHSRCVRLHIPVHYIKSNTDMYGYSTSQDDIDSKYEHRITIEEMSAVIGTDVLRTTGNTLYQLRIEEEVENETKTFNMSENDLYEHIHGILNEECTSNVNIMTDVTFYNIVKKAIQLFLTEITTSLDHAQQYQLSHAQLLHNVLYPEYHQFSPQHSSTDSSGVLLACKYDGIRGVCVIFGDSVQIYMNDLTFNEVILLNKEITTIPIVCQVEMLDDVVITNKDGTESTVKRLVITDVLHIYKYVDGLTYMKRSNRSNICHYKYYSTNKGVDIHSNEDVSKYTIKCCPITAANVLNKLSDCIYNNYNAEFCKIDDGDYTYIISIQQFIYFPEPIGTHLYETILTMADYQYKYIPSFVKKTINTKRPEYNNFGPYKLDGFLTIRSNKDKHNVVKLKVPTVECYIRNDHIFNGSVSEQLNLFLYQHLPVMKSVVRFFKQPIDDKYDWSVCEYRLRILYNTNNTPDVIMEFYKVRSDKYIADSESKCNQECTNILNVINNIKPVYHPKKNCYSKIYIFNCLDTYTESNITFPRLEYTISSINDIRYIYSIIDMYLQMAECFKHLKEVVISPYPINKYCYILYNRLVNKNMDWLSYLFYVLSLYSNRKVSSKSNVGFVIGNQDVPMLYVLFIK